MSAQIDPCVYLYSCETTHRRLTPFKRAFSYRLTYLFLDIDRFAEAVRGNPLVSYNKWGIFSFHDSAHGSRDGGRLRTWAERQFACAGVSLDGGPIWLLTLPRVLGRTFNPLSLFIGYGPDGSPRGVIYEVNNTFGETHAYVARLEGAGLATHSADKLFHVSPFLDVRGRYDFALSPPGECLALTVRNIVGAQCAHVATLSGRRRAFSAASLALSVLAAPLTALSVLTAIHWEAFLIWIKGVRYRPKPTPPEQGVTIAAPTSRHRTKTVVELLG